MSRRIRVTQKTEETYLQETAKFFCLSLMCVYLCLLPILKRLDNNPPPTESHKDYSCLLLIDKVRTKDKTDI